MDGQTSGQSERIRARLRRPPPPLRRLPLPPPPPRRPPAPRRRSPSGDPHHPLVPLLPLPPRRHGPRNPPGFPRLPPPGQRGTPTPLGTNPGERARHRHCGAAGGSGPRYPSTRSGRAACPAAAAPTVPLPLRNGGGGRDRGGLPGKEGGTSRAARTPLGHAGGQRRRGRCHGRQGCWGRRGRQRLRRKRGATEGEEDGGGRAGSTEAAAEGRAADHGQSAEPSVGIGVCRIRRLRRLR
mmetsp:Transcript_24227/g.55129  ORF Transcript_24227/g.55129 Transcript_24227/m.55129 type:complete len:239 (-) Transcript_24227:3884-4600(-)